MSLIRKTTLLTTSSLANIDAGLDFIFSDETEDHYGDVIRVKGWKLPAKLVALAFHKADFVAGSWDNIRIEGNKLKGRLHLAPQGSSSRIDELRALVSCGAIRACSVGFKPIRSKPRENGGVEYLEQELLECSLVAVGANPAALLEAKRLGVSTETIKKIFKEQNNASLADRVVAARASVKHYTALEKAAVMRRAREKLKPKPKLLPLISPEAKARAERDAYNREVHKRAKARVAVHEAEKEETKRLDLWARQDQPIERKPTTITWRGQKIVISSKWRDEDVF